MANSNSVGSSLGVANHQPAADERKWAAEVAKYLKPYAERYQIQDLAKFVALYELSGLSAVGRSAASTDVQKLAQQFAAQDWDALAKTLEVPATGQGTAAKTLMEMVEQLAATQKI